MEIQELYKIYRQYPSIKTDTRKLEAGDIFFALKGPNFNGNQFAGQALKSGAAYVIADEKTGIDDQRIIYVPDALTALQQLAKYHRQQFSIPFIAITGSNGKTTTKELVHQVLSASYKVYTTEGNLNNHIGVPQTILKIKDDAQIAVIEMGANHLHEIEGYCDYAMPTHGLITNCGKAHLEGFGGIEGVKKGKGELFDYLRNNNGFAFVNNDDDYIKKIGDSIQHVGYGSKSGSVTGEATGSSFLEVKIMDGLSIDIIKTQLVGDYNLLNVLAAATVGKHFDVPPEKIKEAIENYAPTNSRSQLIIKGSNKIILDAYNANPSSMKAAIENFAKMDGDKVLMLGSMMELGDESTQEHEAIINLIGKYIWKNVLLVGKNFKEISSNYIVFDTAAEAGRWFNKQNFSDVRILIKGSRSMSMEKVLEA